jgi:hypothetical protein
MLLYVSLCMLLYVTIYVTVHVTVYVTVYVIPESQLSTAVQLWKGPNPQRVTALATVHQNCRS